MSFIKIFDEYEKEIIEKTKLIKKLEKDLSLAEEKIIFLEDQNKHLTRDYTNEIIGLHTKILRLISRIKELESSNN